MTWTLLGSLGRGASGEVFEARLPDGDVVAVKLLSNFVKSSRAAFEAEFAMLSRIRHPSVVSVLGYAARSDFLFGKDRGPCFWMEKVEGTNLLTAARGQSSDKILEWFRQGLEALAFLHAQGVVHGDLSPRNILIDGNSRVKLLDFGLADFLDAGGSVGAATLPYTAPERLDGVHLPASDLFSLGTIFYEALDGRHPRAGGRSLKEIMEKKPRPLHTVIDRTIEPVLSQRLSSASAALEILAGGKRSTYGIADYHPIRMIGVDAAFQRLRRCLKSLASRPVLLAVHGATGTGKSRFLREIALQGSLAGVSCRSGLPKDLKDARGVLVLPDLHERSPDELLPLLERETALQPGNLIVLEWNDDRLPARLRPFFERILESKVSEEIRLKNLDAVGTRIFLENALGEEAAREAAETVFRTTQGNPLLLVETAKILFEERRKTGREFSKTWLKGLSRFDSLERILLSRLETLDDDEGSLLRSLAVAPEPMEVSGPILRRLMDRELVARDSKTGKYRLAASSLAEAVLRKTPPDAIRKIRERQLKDLTEAPDDDFSKVHHAVALGEKELILAGTRSAAERLFADGRHEDALRLVTQALPFVKDNRDETSRLLRLKINLLNELGRFEAALEVCEEWFGLESPLPGDEPAPLRTVKYWFMTGLNHQNIGDHEEAAARLKRCLEVGQAGDETHRPFLARAHSLLGAHEWRQHRRVAEARRHFEEGLELAGPAGRRRAEICRNLAELEAQEGRWDDAGNWFKESERLYAEDGYDPGVFAVRLLQGNLALDRKEPRDFTAAEAAYAAAEAVARRLEDGLKIALVQSNQGVLMRRRGNLALALPLFARAHDVFQILGNRKDLAENLRRWAIAEASAGRFARAEAAIAELNVVVGELPESRGLLHEADACLQAWRDGGPVPDSEAASPAELERVYSALPPEFQVTFAKRSDVRGLSFLSASSAPSVLLPGKNVGGGLVDILNELAALNRELLQEEDMTRVLKRLMDAAMDLSQAESGFLLVQSAKAKGPIPGFQVAVSKKIAKREIERPAYALSLSAVRRAMQTGEAVVTDNAVEDPRFREAKSVHFSKLKSIIALPVTGRNGVLGVFYLDHRYERGLFEGQSLAALNALAGVAALALEKERKIASLSETNERLSEEVETQSSEMGLMHRELQKSRLTLKNEYGDIVGRSPAMMKVLSLVDRVTDAKIPVWIYGESGTGKEAIARALHFNSARAKHPFVTENCSALPESLLESELFGHKKGSFTHASADKKGLLPYADGGTVFLDEVADMSLNLQAKLLRFLQEGEVRPIGSNQVNKVDVRVVSASNKDLAQLVAEGKFRQDLFFRLNGVTATLPPLRERLEDLPLLADHFLDQIAKREKKPRLKLGPETLKVFLAYDWPGNIRELQNTLETAVLFAEKGVITPSSLEFKGFKSNFSRKPAATHPTPSVVEPELVKILRAIRDAGYHRSKAAEALGMSRRNLYARLEKFGVKRDAATLHAYIDRYLTV